MARTEVKRVVVDVGRGENLGCTCGDLAPEYFSCGGMDCFQCPWRHTNLNIDRFNGGDTLVLYSDGTVELIKQEATRHD
jgi:hypothetical protein